MCVLKAWHLSVEWNLLGPCACSLPGLVSEHLGAKVARREICLLCVGKFLILETAVKCVAFERQDSRVCFCQDLWVVAFVSYQPQLYESG